MFGKQIMMLLQFLWQLFLKLISNEIYCGLISNEIDCGYQYFHSWLEIKHCGKILLI